MAKASNAGTERKVGRKGRDKPVSGGAPIEDDVGTGEVTTLSNNEGPVIEQVVELLAPEVAIEPEPETQPSGETIVNSDATLTILTWHARAKRVTVIGKMNRDQPVRVRSGSRLASPRALWFVQAFESLPTHDCTIVMTFIRGTPDLAKGVKLRIA